MSICLLFVCIGCVFQLYSGQLSVFLRLQYFCGLLIVLYIIIRYFCIDRHVLFVYSTVINNTFETFCPFFVALCVFNASHWLRSGLLETLSQLVKILLIILLDLRTLVIFLLRLSFFLFIFICCFDAISFYFNVYLFHLCSSLPYVSLLIVSFVNIWANKHSILSFLSLHNSEMQSTEKRKMNIIDIPNPYKYIQKVSTSFWEHTDCM